MPEIEDRVKGALIGLACGDAVGTTLEFEVKGTFKPITDMVGGGPFNLEAGQWTDDTSMALCLGHSLNYRKGFDPIDQMNRYCNWYQLGYMSSTGECFDIGGTVAQALRRYLDTKDPFSGSIDEFSSGNGSVMRLAPIPIFYSSSSTDCIKYAGESSRTTHGSAECIDSCRLYASLILSAFSSNAKNDIFSNCHYEPYCDSVRGLAKPTFTNLSYDQLQGSGYVIESVQSALWCFLNSDSFEEAILLSANIGNDADTTAAICGQLAGAYYGFSGIPERWRKAIVMAEEIQALAISLYRTGIAANN